MDFLGRSDTIPLVLLGGDPLFEMMPVVRFLVLLILL